MVTNYIENMKNDSAQELSWKKLYYADHILPVPFQLRLTDNKELLQCEEIIRIIPRKRLVVFGTWGNKPVVAKLFYGRGRVKHHQRDALGIELLMKANVPTPQLLYQGSAQQQPIRILLFERILLSMNLYEIWQTKMSIAELLPLMRAVILELATQHVLGILQRDLHLKNFLVTQKKIYTLDGDKISTSDEPLNKKTSLENLSVFFAQLGVGTDDLRQQLYQYYAEARGWIVTTADLNMLHKGVARINQYRWQCYQEKIFRNCTAFVTLRTTCKFAVYDRAYQSSEFLNLLQNPDQAFTAQNPLLKAGRSSSVVKIKINNHILVIKRYNIKNAWHGLRRCLRPTRAINGWQLAQRLQLLGVSTAKPVACIEQRFLGLRGKSYFIMEYVEGPHLGKYFSIPQIEDEQHEVIAERVVNLFKNLSELHITHGDLKMTNILIAASPPAAKEEQPVLIDLDGMQEHRSLFYFKRAFKNEMQRFMENWKNYPAVYSLFEKLLAQSCILR